MYEDCIRFLFAKSFAFLVLGRFAKPFLLHGFAADWKPSFVSLTLHSELKNLAATEVSIFQSREWCQAPLAGRSLLNICIKITYAQKQTCRFIPRNKLE
jgi:hypothetical protein